ncbi:hypothetical protein [Cupriavidus pauculus]|uniref:Uncharacterized protein n=1 Tax=Cupriavidus pauculus TaxID=82633 RepID=A0A3G8H2U2_9BURK|nr:hypothetical protein [Cupriavidus pauculus]AZG14831.1 hypothetical protein EHF44_16155 [Cupriavidus pauculus]
MKLALHPVDARMISVQAYLDEYGARALQGEAPQPRCPLCHRALLLIGALSTRIRPRFSHGANCRLPCPLVRHGDLPDGLRIDPSPDVHVSVAQRHAYVSRWEWHLQRMRRDDLLPSMPVERFLSLAELATQGGLWRQAGLHPALVPYLQLAMAGFLPGERGTRHGGSSVRFWFDGSAGSVADVQALRDPAPRFYKAYYARPRLATVPSQHHMFHLEEVALDLGFLAGPRPGMPAADVEACWAWLSGRGS